MPLSDDQWARLAALAGLPAEARAYIEACIAWYQSARSPSPHTTKMRKMALALAGYIDQLGELEIVGLLEQFGSAEVDRTARDKIVGDLKNWAAKFEVLRPQGKWPGPKFVSAVALVVEHFTGRRTTRSYKDPLGEFLAELCAIVDSDIGQGTIDEALKARVTRDKRRRGEIDD
jgi:hypothetical protein